jgi:hypothetical protein
MLHVDAMNCIEMNTTTTTSPTHARTPDAKQKKKSSATYRSNGSHSLNAIPDSQAADPNAGDVGKTRQIVPPKYMVSSQSLYVML